MKGGHLPMWVTNLPSVGGHLPMWVTNLPSVGWMFVAYSSNHLKGKFPYDGYCAVSWKKYALFFYERFPRGKYHSLFFGIIDQKRYGHYYMVMKNGNMIPYHILNGT